VKPVSARAEAVTEWGSDRAAEGDGGVGRTTTKRRESGRSRGAVWTQVRPTLEAAQGGVGAGAESSVEGTRREAVRGERELERGDVPASLSHGEHASSELVPAIRPQGAARLPAGNAVDGDVGASLESADGCVRPGPHDAVDGPVVQATGVQRYLQGGDIGRAGAHRGRWSGEGEAGDECGDERFARHNPGRGTNRPKEGNPLEGENVSAAPEEQSGSQFVLTDTGQRDVLRVDGRVRPIREAKRFGAVTAADLEQVLRGDDVATQRLAARSALELTQLLEGIDAHV
jgi:hypothetical protein